MLKQYKLKNYHFQLILYLSLLTIIGILLIGSAKESVQNKQIVGFVGGLIVMIIVSLIDYSFILRFAWFYYAIIIALLVLVKTPVGDSSGGAQRWIEIPVIDFRFQPSELAKIVLILFFAYFFGRYHEKINTIKILAISMVLVGIPLVLIITQPDTSTAIVTAFIFCILLFIAGLSIK